MGVQEAPLIANYYTKNPLTIIIYMDNCKKNHWSPYAGCYGNKFISSQWHCFSKQVTSFKGNTQKVIVRRIYKSTQPKTEPHAWASVNFVVTNGLK